MSAPPASRRPTAFGVALVGAVAALPFVTFAEENRSQLTDRGRLLAYAVGFVALSIGVLWALVRAAPGKDPARLAMAVATVVASFTNFSLLFDPDPKDGSKQLAVLVTWTLGTALVARLAFLVGGDPNVRTAVTVFVAVLVVVPAVSYTFEDVAEEDLTVVPLPDVPPVSDRPNVYWLVLDSYDRPDVLQDVIGVDVTGFVEHLEGRGFQVSTSSRTSYPRTHLSLASTLEMRYVREPGQPMEDEFEELSPVVVGNNRTVARFRAHGYQIVYGEAGGIEWSACRTDLVDVCLPLVQPSFATGEMERALLDLTPLGTVALPVAYSDPVRFAEAMTALSSEMEEPFFAFQHVFAPHYPFRYRADCSPRAVPSDQRAMSFAEAREAYGVQARCLAGLVSDAVDRIVETDPDAVIIIQSDHGSEFGFSWGDRPEQWSTGQLNERYGAFNAIRLPAGCPGELEGAALVNTFRIVFACLEGTEPDLLDYRAFAPPFGDPTGVLELGPERFEE